MPRHSVRNLVPQREFLLCAGVFTMKEKKRKFARWHLSLCVYLCACNTPTPIFPFGNYSSLAFQNKSNLFK